MDKWNTQKAEIARYLRREGLFSDPPIPAMPASDFGRLISEMARDLYIHMIRDNPQDLDYYAKRAWIAAHKFYSTNPQTVLLAEEDKLRESKTN